MMPVAVSDDALPIDDVIDDVVAAASRGNAVLEAPPGAGKTTRVPPALLDCIDGEILVAQPRRLAARMAARRVASQLGERVGQRVGYQVRFDDKTGPDTRQNWLAIRPLEPIICSSQTISRLRRLSARSP